MESEMEVTDGGGSSREDSFEGAASNTCEVGDISQESCEELTSGNGNRVEKVNDDEPTGLNAGRKRTGAEVIETSCMICYAPCEQNPKVRRQNPGINASSSTGIGRNEDVGSNTSAVVDEGGDILDSEGVVNPADSDMGVMFVLRRLLLFPKSLCEELLETYGAPAGWNTAFCTFCANTIEEAQEIAEKISNYQMKFKCLQERFKDEILISAQEQVVPMDMDTSAVVEDIRQRFVQIHEDGQQESDTFVGKPLKAQTGLNINTQDDSEIGIYPDEDEVSQDRLDLDLNSVKVEGSDWDDEEDHETGDQFSAWEDLPEPGSVCQVVVKGLKDESEESGSSSETQCVLNKTSRFNAKGRSRGLTKKTQKESIYKFKCPRCRGRFSSVQLMNSHYASKHSGGRSKKREVSRTRSCSSEREGESGDENDLGRRPGRGERKYLFKCHDCPQRFPSEFFRDAHHRRRHLKIRLCFICDRCGKAYERNDSLKTHKKSCEGDGTFVHPDAKLQETEKFKCPKCPRHYPSEMAVEIHLKRLHMGIKLPFECKVEGCKKAYKRKGELAAHEIRCKKGDESDAEVSGDSDNFELDQPVQNEIDHDEDKDKSRKGKIMTRPKKRSKTKSSDRLKTVVTEVKLPFECKVEGCIKSFKSKRLLTAHEKRCTKGDEAGKASADGESSGLDEPTQDDDELDLDSDYEENGSEEDEKKRLPKERSRVKVKTLKREREYRCCISDCEIVFKEKRLRDLHWKTMHAYEGKPKAFTCEVCGKCFAQLQYLKTHQLTHSTAGNPFKCEKCGKELSLGSSLKRHYKFVHGHGEEQELIKIKCDQCDRQFQTTTCLNLHKRCVHEKLRSYICELCGDGFPRPTTLTYHRHSKHWKELNLEPYKCDKCDPVRYFTQPYFKVQHEKLVHAKAYTLFCPVCNQGFITPSALNRHKLNHGEKEKPCICEVCGKGFPRPSELQRHMMMHTGERPFCCEHCGKRYSYERDLKKHLIKHDPPKFECDVCFKKFFTSSRVIRHRKTHDPGHVPARTARRGRKKNIRFNQPHMNDESSTSNASSIDQDCQIPGTSNQRSGSDHFRNQTLNQSSYVANGTVHTQQHLPTPQAAHSIYNRVELQSQAHPFRPGHGHPSAFGNNSDVSRRVYDPMSLWLNNLS